MNEIEKAIDDLDDLKNCESISSSHFKEVHGKNLELAISALEKQLSNGWIPCSERLPEVCGLGVLLTIENKFQQRKVIQGFTGYMEMGKLEFHTNDKCTNLEVWNVIAWQSLPEPWKEM